MSHNVTPHLKRRLTALTCALGLAAMAAAMSAQAREMPSHFAIVQNAIDKFAVPRFQAFDQAAATLPRALEPVCKSGDAGAREELDARFRDTVKAWAAVEYLRFGPLAEGGRRERLSFWPDPRGVMTRQLRQMLLNKDLKALESTPIVKQSAAVQGLPALEVLLTDKDNPLGPGDQAAYRCALAKAITDNVAAIAHDILEGWTTAGGWKEKMLRPGSDNDVYKEPSEAAAEFVKAMLTGLQILSDTEVKPHLEPAIAAGGGEALPGLKDKPVTGPFNKIGLSRDYFVAGASALEALNETLDLEGYLPEDKDWVKNWAGNAWRAMRESDGAGGPPPGGKKSLAPPVKELHTKINGLRQLIGKEMASAAGLTLGFNELDGD